MATAIPVLQNTDEVISQWLRGQPRGPLVFSTTESGDSFHRCEQSWLWGSMNGFGLERPLPGAALSLGSLFHYTMADWGELYKAWEERTSSLHATNASGKKMVLSSRDAAIQREEADRLRPDPIAIFEAHYQSFRASVFERYAELNSSEMDQFEYDESYEETVGEMGRAMVANYWRRWGSPYPDGCTLIAPEQTIVMPVPKVRPRQRQLYIEATLDQLLADEEGNVLIRDFKTFNDKPSDYELEANDQFMTYHWICRTEFPQYKIAGVIYDGVWKRKEITSRMRKTEEDLQFRYYCLYSDEKIDNHAKIVPFRLAAMAQKLRERRLFGPNALDKSRGWATCPGCSFNDPCQQLLDGDYGDWDDEAEAIALSDYRRRVASPAWRIPLPKLAEMAS